MNREQATVYLTLLGWEPFSDRLQGIVGIRHPDGSNSVVINTHNIMTTLEDVRASPRILHTAWCCLYDDELKRICDVLDIPLVCYVTITHKEKTSCLHTQCVAATTHAVTGG
jgi:hypothetical protein